MNVNEKIISTKTELLETIKQGVNILDYIKDERDIDLVTNAIVTEKNDEDSYYEETAEIVFNSILILINSEVLDKLAEVVTDNDLQEFFEIASIFCSFCNY